MAYDLLNSPLPGLTVTEDGSRCCGMRGMGAADDVTEFDTSYTDPGGGLVDPTVIDPVEISPIDYTLTPGPMEPELPLAPSVGPSLNALSPSTIGTNFVLDSASGEYLNLQTGQLVPEATAQAITAASTGAGTANLDTVATGQGPSVTITDPNSGATSTVAVNGLSAAAQSLQAAGQLVNAAGKLTAQGQALLNAGNLYNPLPATGVNLSAAVSSLTSWFTGETLIAGVPNWIVGFGAVALLGVVSSMTGKKRRR